MNYLKQLPAVFVLLTLIPQLSAGQRLTLTEAIDRAVTASQELAIAREEVRRSELASTQASAGRLPQLDFSGKYVYTSEVMEMVQPPTTVDLGFTSVTIPGQELAFGDEHTADFRLQVTQPIFTGLGLQKAHRASQYEVLAKRADLRRIELKIHCDAEEAYTLAQKASALVEVVQKQVDILERHYADAQRKVAAGVAPQEMSARAELALQQAQLHYKSSKRKKELAFIALRELLDMRDADLEIVLDELSESPLLEFDPEEMVSRAFQNRAEFDVLRIRQDILGEFVGVQQASFYPSLVAFGALNYGRPGVDRFANDWMFFQTAGVSLNWTLWDWNKRSSRVQEVRVSSRQLDETREALESRVRLQVHSAVQTIDDARERLDIAFESCRLSEDILNWVGERYEQGIAAEIDYLDAVDDNNRYETEKIIAWADYYVALVQLKRACGTEDE